MAHGSSRWAGVAWPAIVEPLLGRRRVKLGRPGAPASKAVPGRRLLLGLGPAPGGRARKLHPGARPPAGAPYQLAGAACLRMLAARGIRVEPWSAPASGACRVNTPVRAWATASSPRRGDELRHAGRLERPRAGVQRAARSHLGSPVSAVRHFGSYGCRGMNGNGGRPSLHASRAPSTSPASLGEGPVGDGAGAGAAARGAPLPARGSRCGLPPPSRHADPRQRPPPPRPPPPRHRPLAPLRLRPGTGPARQTTTGRGLPGATRVRHQRARRFQVLGHMPLPRPLRLAR